MNRRRGIILGLGLVALAGVLWAGQAALQTAGAQSGQAPIFEVDPLWPKPLPNNWRIGSSIGVDVDDQDVVWMIHRPATLAAGEIRATPEIATSDCCVPAPPVLAFDQEGNLVQAWGGPGEGFEWPSSNHGIFVDHMGYVWIGSNGANDSHILKFTKDGTFVAQYGRQNARVVSRDAEGNPTIEANSNDPESFGQPAKIFVDAEANEAYIADGYLNRRVAVLDANTGQIVRYWGAYGNRPDDVELPPYDPAAPPRQHFGSPVHCADVSVDRLVYACDRTGNRIQVFQTDGTFVSEAFYAQSIKGNGAAWDIAFSPDPDQTYIYMTNGSSEKVHVILRETMEELYRFGGGGRQPGLFYGAHSIATDSQGNIYVTETFEGKRIQRFLNRGIGPIRAADVGAPWPVAAAQ
jgi:DNA-binding beta-propeller fold protein YncE